MRRVIALLLIVAASFGFGQDMMAGIPEAELKAVAFMNGNFKADLTFSFGGQDTKGTGSIKSEMGLNGRFQRAMHSYVMEPGQPAMEGMQMLTYNPDKKKYVSHWFDGTSPTAIEMSGDLKDGTLTVSGDADMMGQKMKMRATYKKTADGFSFVLEMDQGGTWSKLISGTYKKV